LIEFRRLALLDPLNPLSVHPYPMVMFSFVLQSMHCLGQKMVSVEHCAASAAPEDFTHGQR